MMDHKFHTYEVKRIFPRKEREIMLDSAMIHNEKEQGTLLQMHVQYLKF